MSRRQYSQRRSAKITIVKVKLKRQQIIRQCITKVEIKIDTSENAQRKSKRTNQIPVK